MKFKNIIIIFLALGFLILDAVGSMYFITGIKPWEYFLTSKNKGIQAELKPVTIQNNSTNSTENDLIFINNFIQTDTTAGKTLDLICDYKNNLNQELSVYTEIVLVSQGKLNDSRFGDGYSFFLASQKNQLDSNSGQVSMKYNLPINLPDGFYRGMMNVYSDDYREFKGRCGTKLFHVINPTPGSLVLKSEDNKIITIVDNKEHIALKLIGTSGLNKIMPKIQIVDPVNKTNGLYFEETQKITSLKNNQESMLKIDLSGFKRIGIYNLVLYLYNEKGALINIPPYIPFTIGYIPKIKDITLFSDSDREYKLGISYEDEIQFSNDLLQIMVSVCDTNNCNYAKKSFKEGSVKEIEFVKNNIELKHTLVTITMSSLGNTGVISKFTKQL